MHTRLQWVCPTATSLQPSWFSPQSSPQHTDLSGKNHPNMTTSLSPHQFSFQTPYHLHFTFLFFILSCQISKLKKGGNLGKYNAIINKNKNKRLKFRGKHSQINQMNWRIWVKETTSSTFFVVVFYFLFISLTLIPPTRQKSTDKGRKSGCKRSCGCHHKQKAAGLVLTV